MVFRTLNQGWSLMLMGVLAAHCGGSTPVSTLENTPDILVETDDLVEDISDPIDGSPEPDIAPSDANAQEDETTDTSPPDALICTTDGDCIDAFVLFPCENSTCVDISSPATRFTLHNDTTAFLPRSIAAAATVVAGSALRQSRYAERPPTDKP